METVRCNPVKRAEEIREVKQKAVKEIDVPSDYFTESKYEEFLEEGAGFFIGVKGEQIVATGGYKKPNKEVKIDKVKF